MTQSPAHIGRNLRVGITGAVRLDETQLPRLRHQLAELLADIKRLATETEGAAMRFTMLSPLAEGADRLAATAALDAGFDLVCPLPFKADDYLNDFATPQSRDDFHHLLAEAHGRTLSLDGARGGPADWRAYEAVGRLVVRNSDLLIGIWDGGPGKGRGGTADTVRFAARSGPPVIWLHATNPDIQPRWIEETADLRPNAIQRGLDPALPTYLARLLTPPAPPAPKHHSLVHRVAHHLRVHHHHQRGETPPSPLETFLAEPKARIGHRWKLHTRMMEWLGGKSHWTKLPPPETPEAQAWFAHYEAPDARAGEQAKFYRSSYVWAFLFGFVALAFSAVGLAIPHPEAIEFAAAIIELVALQLILCMVWRDATRGWQRKSIEYRLLAELCRKQQILAPLAWVVPRASAWAGSGPEPEPAVDESASWVLWLFSAWLRDLPLPTGHFDHPRVAAAQQAALTDLIGDQITYHTSRRDQYLRASQRLRHFGEVIFFIIMALVILRIVLFAAGADAHVMAPIGLACAVLPAAAAALFGVRAYAEMEMLAAQSDMMLHAMTHARQHISTLDPATPLASQDLGAALAGVAILMLEDLQGWARLIRSKVTEG